MIFSFFFLSFLFSRKRLTDWETDITPLVGEELLVEVLDDIPLTMHNFVSIVPKVNLRISKIRACAGQYDQMLTNDLYGVTIYTKYQQLKESVESASQMTVTVVSICISDKSTNHQLIASYGENLCFYFLRTSVTDTFPAKSLPQVFSVSATVDLCSSSASLCSHWVWCCILWQTPYVWKTNLFSGKSPTVIKLTIMNNKHLKHLEIYY